MHASVLLSEIIEVLRPVSSGIYLDGTLGAGGYAEAILRASEPGGRVVGLDVDAQAIHLSRDRLREFGDRFEAVHGGYHEARTILAARGIDSVDGAVLDLGLSSDQLDEPSRGFTFRADGPLDMRFDTDSGETAASLLSSISLKKLEEILATYGEERYCKKLARAMVDARNRGKLQTTRDLADMITRLLGRRREKIHPATRTFQALRIAVNRELERLSVALEEIPQLLKPGGRLCVVSYHSLEDRAVKLAFRERAHGSHEWMVITKKPVRPSADELRNNPRSRSSRMRALERIDEMDTRRKSEEGAGRSCL
jgi:16S rRNA (cytosine1402-N4)-methyltransferase